MGNHELSQWEEYGRFKTVRQKKRLLKKDSDKQLIQLNNTRNELWRKIRALPLVPLEEPYQRGWQRTFVLRYDVAISKDAEFFQKLLDKINTVQYSHKRMFQVKKRQRGKKIYVDKPQYLNSFYMCDWKRNNLKNSSGEPITFSNKEKEYFSIKELPLYNGNLVQVLYFNEAWRFVQKVKPNIITHTILKDRALLSEQQKLENYLTQRNLSHRMYKLVRGRKQNRWKVEERDPLTKKELFHLMSEYENHNRNEDGN